MKKEKRCAEKWREKHPKRSADEAGKDLLKLLKKLGVD